jgi:uncharacterized cupredoxin-like copper-binding protein
MSQSIIRAAMAALVLSAGAALSATALAAATEKSHGGAHGFAFGKPGTASEVTRTIEVIARDNEFEPAEISVKSGETIRFVIRNQGEFLHEFNIGKPEMHKQHQARMLEMMDHGMMMATGINHDMMMKGASGGHMMAGMTHDDPNSVLVEPGETKEMIWTFAGAEGIEFACNVPGHYESGMMGPLKIEPGHGHKN